MYRRITISLVSVVAMLAAVSADAGIASKAIQEAVEFAGRKFGREVAEEGVEQLSARMAKLAATHGDEIVVAAFKKVGPQAGRIASEAGEHGGIALHLLARYGDDALPVVAKAASLKTVAKYGDEAASALIKHGVVGEQLVERFAQEGVEALARVTPQNGRRLAMLAAEGQLKPELMAVVTRYGDDACDFIWRNKGSLAVGATLATFIASPAEFLDGTQKLTTAVAEAVVKPLAEVPKTIAAEAARNTNWTLLAVLTAVVAGVLAWCWRWKVRSVSWVFKRWAGAGSRRATRPKR